jgi:hypothetical protein
MEQNKWQLILHEQREDPYFEITNGHISLCANAGLVGESEDEEDAIFKKVTEALDNSGIDFHSESKLELAQHIKIQELDYAGDNLARAARSLRLSVTAHPDYTGEENAEWTDLVEGIDEALAEWKGEKEVKP